MSVAAGGLRLALAVLVLAATAGWLYVTSCVVPRWCVASRLDRAVDLALPVTAVAAALGWTLVATWQLVLAMPPTLPVPAS